MNRPWPTWQQTDWTYKLKHQHNSLGDKCALKHPCSIQPLKFLTTLPPHGAVMICKASEAIKMITNGCSIMWWQMGWYTEGRYQFCCVIKGLCPPHQGTWGMHAQYSQKETKHWGASRSMCVSLIAFITQLKAWNWVADCRKQSCRLSKAANQALMILLW